MTHAAPPPASHDAAGERGASGNRARFDWAPFAGVAVFAALGWLWLDEHGVALSRDAALYLSVATDLRFAGFALPAEPAYPVGYPLLVSQVMRFEPFAVDAARIVSWLSYVVLIGASASLYRRVAGPVPASLALACLATMPPVVVAQGHALSDAPFGALLQLHVAFVAAHAAANGRSRIAWLTAAAAVLGLATIVRVIGYAPIVVFTGYVLLEAIALRERPRCVLALGLAHAPCYLPALGVAAAYSVMGRPVHGYRGGSQEPLTLNLGRAVETLSNDLGAALLVPAAVGVALFALGALARVRAADAPDGRGAWVAVGYAIAMIGVYLTAIIAAATVTKVSPVGSRFFAPCYGLFLLVGLGAAGLPPARGRRVPAIAVSLVLLVVGGANVSWLGRLHRELDEAAQRPRLHFQQGFGASPSARPLREFLGALGGGDVSTSLSVLSPLPRGGHHVEGALSLLLVRAAMASPVEAVELERVAPDLWRVRLADAPAGGGLLYVPLRLDTASELTAEQTLSAVVAAMVESRRRVHWLLVPGHADPLRAVGAIEGVPLRIDERREVGAYRAYRFELARPASTATGPGAGESTAHAITATQPMPVQPTSRLATSSRGIASSPRAAPTRKGRMYKTSRANGNSSIMIPKG